MSFNLPNEIIKFMKSPVAQKSESEINAIRKKGYYEVWYTMVENPKNGDFFWLRITCLISKYREDDGTFLWFGYFNRLDPAKNFMVKKRYPFDAGEFSTNELTIASDHVKLAVDRMQASFSLEDERKFGWDLEFSHFMKPYHHVPFIGSALKVIKTIPITHHPNATANGTLIMEGREITIKEGKSTQTHLTGRGYKETWGWAHCNSFENNKNAFFEVSVKGSFGTMGLFDGSDYYLFNTATTILKVKTKLSLLELQIVAESHSKKIVINVSVEPERLLPIEYLGPKRERIVCINSEHA